MEYLDFELPIKELAEQLDKCQIIGQKSDVDVTETCKNIEKKLGEKKKEIYGNLIDWERLVVSRHPNRPYTIAYIKAACRDAFLSLIGDLRVKDEKETDGGLGMSILVS